MNDAAYLLLLGAAAESGLSSRWVEDQVLPPVIHLSHDCDNLRDSSVWLQLARLKRSVRRPARWALDAKQLRFVGEAALGLRDNPASDMGELPKLESTYGFWSRFYFINGQRGRYGARSRDFVTFGAAASIDSPHEVGLHYNYDTHLSVARLRRQRQELEVGTGRKVVAGRAHYLRFDMIDSPPVWTAAGIRLDESIGYPDQCGFRVGLGGVFRPLGPDGVALPIACIPLVAMDVAMAVVDPVNPAKPVCELLDRVALVGGAAGILFHPGHLASDEFPQFRGVYQEILQHAAGLGARQQTTSEVLANHGIEY